MDSIAQFISEFGKKMPFESILFFTYHIWLFIMILSAILIIGTGIHSGLEVSLVLVTLGLFLLYIVPIVAIVQTIVRSRNDLKKVLYCMPLLIVGIIHTLTAFAVQIRIVMYVRETDPFTYTLLIPVQRLVELVANPLIEWIFNMNFPYNLLIPDVFYVVVLPASLLIYLLPSIDYDREKITKEMKQIALLPLICAIIPVILQTIQLKFGLIDDIMIKFFWTEILMNIGKFLFLLVPILGILYIKHYNKVMITDS
jgi:hypothetical protein